MPRARLVNTIGGGYEKDRASLLFPSGIQQSYFGDTVHPDQRTSKLQASQFVGIPKTCRRKDSENNDRLLECEQRGGGGVK